MLSLKFASELPAAVRKELEALVSTLNAWLSKHGTWQDVSYDATNFSGVGLMTWTVGPECVTTFTYQINGDDMRIWLELNATTVGGTVGSELRVLIPAGKTAGRTIRTPIRVLDNGVTYSIGDIVATTGSRYLALHRFNPTTWALENWSAATKTTCLWGTFDFPLAKG